MFLNKRALTIPLTLYSLTAQASLTVSGANLVLDSGSNNYWTADANLLNTLEKAQGFDKTVNAIISANGGKVRDLANDYDSAPGEYALSVDDFGEDGMVDWWGASAFIHYLNTINYAGSSSWALPTTTAAAGYYLPGNQLGELYYDQLGLKGYEDREGQYQSDFGIFRDGVWGGVGISNDLPPFVNVQSTVYWTGLENTVNPSFAWSFDNGIGFQRKNFKGNPLYVWAVSPANSVNISAVPLPGALGLFMLGVTSLFGLNRKK
jgi:hypothetical protein